MTAKPQASLPANGRQEPAGKILAFLAATVWLAGCSTTGPEDSRRSRSQVLSSWVQLGAGSDAELRAIARPADGCPAATVNGIEQAMIRRADASPALPPDAAKPDNPAFNPDFAVLSCALTLKPSVREVSIDGQRLALRKPNSRRIVVLGDTGCRIKVPASGKADPIQDCTDPQAWPWARIAAAAARTQPDLVIHVGDYHYREYCDNPERCGALQQKGTVIDYGWAGWNADFFTPAAPLLAAAPWVFVRGNHENCDRGGEGWMRFLSPLPYRACADQRIKSTSRSQLGNNLTAEAYRIDLDETLALVVADNSGHEDYRPANQTPHDVAVFRQTLGALRSAPATQRLWLLAHKPIWYDLLEPASQPNALQTVLRDGPPANLQLAFSGHQHAFETINFAPDADPYHPSGRPAQVIVGGSGTQLESLDPHSPLYEGLFGPGSKERARPDARLYEGIAASSGIVLNRYSFLLLEGDQDGWAGTVINPDGEALSHCRLSGRQKALSCRSPDHASR